MPDGRGNSHLLPSLAVALCGAMWGLFWLPLRWFSEEGVGGGWTSLIYSLLAMACALPFLLGRRHWQGSGDALLNGLLLGTAFTLYTVSLVLTDVVHAILLFYLTPVWSALAGLLLFGERLGAWRVLAMAMGFAGLAAVLGISRGSLLPGNAGDVLALGSGMLWAAGTMRSFRRPTSRIALPVFAFGLGGAAASFVILMLSPHWLPGLADTGRLAGLLPWIVLTGLVIFVPPNFLVLWAAQRIDATRVGILLMTEVLFGAISAGFYSGEPFGIAEAAGTALIVGAGLIEVLRH